MTSFGHTVAKTSRKFRHSHESARVSGESSVVRIPCEILCVKCANVKIDLRNEKLCKTVIPNAKRSVAK